MTREPQKDGVRAMSELGGLIKKLRTKRKMSLSEVATDAGLSKAQVWDLEQGRSTNPTVSTLYRLTFALNCSAEALAKAAINDRHASYEAGNGG